MTGNLKNLVEHEQFMREAIKQAEYALDGDETPVGCVLVRKGQIIARGTNDTNRSLNGTRHAELVALETLLSAHADDFPDLLREVDLYVTVEPCIMCASALRQYQIRSVFFGATNEKFGGTGSVLEVHNGDVDSSDRKNALPPYPVSGGIYREEAIMLLRKFYIQENEKAPEPHRKRTRELKTDILPTGNFRVEDRDFETQSLRALLRLS